MLEELSYRDYWKIVLRHRWLVVVLALAGGLAGLGAARLQSPVPYYAGVAVIRYDPRTGFNLGGGAGAPSFDLTAQVIHSRSTTVVGNAARRLKLIPEDTRNEDLDKYANVLGSMRARVNVTTDARLRNGLMYFRTAATTAADAAALANAMAGAFQEENLTELRSGIVGRREFIEKEIANDEGILNDAQLEYERYRREHAAALIDPGTMGAVSALAAQDAAMQQLHRKIEETQRQLSLVRSGSPVSDLGLQVIVGGAASARLSQLSTRYTKLTLERDQMLTELTEAHPAVQQKGQLLEAVRVNLEDELNLNMEAFQRHEEEERAKLADLQSREVTLPVEAMQLAKLAREVRLYENLVTQLRTQLQDALIKEAGVAGEVSIVQLATPFPFPVNPPQYLRLGSLGFGGGMFAALVLAVLIESGRFSRARLREIEESLEIPVLGVAPIVTAEALRAWLPDGERIEEDSPRWPRALALGTLLAPRSPAAESYRTLRAGLLGKMSPGHNCLALTASLAREGITTTAVNLAISFAQAGQRVLLVEADFRHPDVSELLGVVREPGLADWLLGSAGTEQATRSFADFVTGALGLNEVLRGPGMDHLHVMPCGNLASSSEDLLGSDALQSKLESLQQAFDVVIFDCPSLAVSADAMVIGRCADLVMVYDPRRAERSDLGNAVGQLRKAGCSVVGLFVNGMDVPPEVEQPEEKPAVAATA